MNCNINMIMKLGIWQILMKKNSNNKPSEMRAVRNEDISREKSNIGKRKDYDGKKDK